MTSQSSAEDPSLQGKEMPGPPLRVGWYLEDEFLLSSGSKNGQKEA